MRRALAAPVALVFLTAVAACGNRPQTAAPAAQPEAAAATPAAPASAPLVPGHGSAPAPMTVEAIAAAPGGLSIADVFAKRELLDGKEVTVRGKVVKANNQILGRNWIHLQDGSGSATDRTNDLTVTSDAVVKVGDLVTFTGVLATRRDIGEGYVYDAIVEQARIVR